MNRLITVLMFLGIVLLNITSIHAEIVEGRDYKVLKNPQPTRDSARIEVIEFFWYGCPHCNNLHPHIKAWLEKKPDDVDFRYVPAIFRDNWEPGAKTYYSIETLDAIEPLHDRVFHAVHRDKINLSNESTLFAWIERQGVDKEKFINIYNSFTTQNQIARTKQMMRQYNLAGVPGLVVDGRYLVTGKKGGTMQDIIQSLNGVIEMVRGKRVQ